MENIKRTCALGRFSVQPTPAPIEKRTTSTMQMTDRHDARTVPKFKDIFEIISLTFKGVMDYLDKSIDRLARSVEK